MSTNEAPEPAIHQAARRGDLETLKRLLADGVPIDTRFDVETDCGTVFQQLTPLMTAARSIDGATADTLAWLLDHGADLHAVSKGGVTAAWYAAGKGGRWHSHHWQLVPAHAERLRFLLDAGLDPHEVSCTGQSLMAEACFAGDPVAVQLLLERGVSCEPMSARRNNRNPFLSTRYRKIRSRGQGKYYQDQIPIFGAVESGSLKCVQLLLEQGARIDHTDEYGYDLLDVALNREDHYAPPPRKVRSLLIHIPDLLLKAGVPLEYPKKRGRPRKHGATRLYWIAFCQQEQGVEYLLKRGVSLLPDAKGLTALHAICWHGQFPLIPTQERIIRMLVAAGVPIDARNSEGATPLHWAICGDVSNPESVRILLELGASVEAQSTSGSYPLHWAVNEPCLKSVELLLAYGANPLSLNYKGQTPVDLARRQKEKRDKNALEDPEFQRVADMAQSILDLLESVSSTSST